MTSTMRAVVFDRFGGPEVLRVAETGFRIRVLGRCGCGCGLRG